MLQANINYHLSDKWFLSSGLQIHDFSIRTVVDQDNFNTLLQKHIVPGIPLGINHVFRADKKWNIEVGTGSLFLIPSLKRTIIVNGNIFLEDGQLPQNRFSKSEQATFPNAITINPYLKAGINVNLEKIALFWNYQYNIGTSTVLDRTIKYSLIDQGEANISTNGTGIQTAFGVRFKFKEKTK
jgi:hypothetical protein